jgi:hypothetical protein
MPLVVAHAGHVLIDLPIYLGPVVALVVWLKLANWREKRAAKRASGGKVREPSPGPGD